MKGKDFGLYIALGVLVLLALMSEKRILVAQGLALTRGELEQGRLIYVEFCEKCHQRTSGGFFLTKSKTWPIRDPHGMAELITHATGGFYGPRGWMPPRGGHPELSSDEVALAVAYMVYADGQTGR